MLESSSGSVAWWGYFLTEGGTIPLHITLNLALGASIALVGHPMLSQERVLRSPAMWSLVGLLCFVSFPLGLYVVHAYPAWSMVYWVDDGALPLPAWVVGAVGPVLGLMSFLVARNLVQRERSAFAFGMVGLGMLGLVVLLGVWAESFSLLGSTSDFRSLSKALVPLKESRLAYQLGGALTLFFAAWGWCMWRLRLLGRAMKLKAQQSEALEQVSKEPPKAAAAGDTRIRRDAKGRKRRRTS